MSDQQQPLIPEVLDPITRPLPKPNNGNGRPKGATNLKHQVFKKLAYHHAIDLTERLIAEALAGDMSAMKIIMDRIWPRPRTAPITLRGLPETQSPDDLRKAMHEMLARVAKGEVTTDDGQAIVSMMTDIIRAHSIESLTGGAATAVQATDSRALLADRLARVIEARRIQSSTNEEPDQNSH